MILITINKRRSHASERFQGGVYVRIWKDEKEGAMI